MTQAVITINGVPGKDDDLPINQIVALDNLGNGGEITYQWSILDQPPGVADLLSATSIQNPTFTPRKEGTYLLKLVVNKGLPDEVTNQTIAAVRQVKTRERIPAAGETREDDTARGWATDLNQLLVRVDALLSDPGIIVGVNSSGGNLARGDIVRATSVVTIKSGLPGQEKVPGFVKAPATVKENMDEMLCIVERDTFGNTTIGNGQLIVVRYIGRFEAAPISAPVGSTVFCSDTAVPAITSGTVTRRLGSIMATSGGVSDIWFDGVGGYDITPLNAPYVTYGNPGILTNAVRIDGVNATPAAVGGVPFMFAAGDGSTVALAAKRFGSPHTAAQIEAQSETGFPFVRLFDNTVELRTDTPDGNGVTVGGLQALDVNSSATDKRLARISVLTDGATGANRGGRLRFEIKPDGVDGLATRMDLTHSGLTVSAGLSTTPGVTGNGASGNGAGVVGNGGATNGNGVYGQGAGSGNGVQGVGGGNNGAGVTGVGGATNGNGVYAEGAGSGRGLRALGGPTNGTGVYSEGQGTGAGLQGIGGGTSGIGVTATGGIPNGHGAVFAGTGTGSGVRGTGGATGPGVVGIGGGGNTVGGDFTGAGTANGVTSVSGSSGGSGYGVSGTGGGGNAGGVLGTASGAGDGVRGTASGGCGVRGISGVSGNSGGIFSNTAGGFALVLQQSGGAVQAPFRMPITAQPSGPNTEGDLYMATGGVLKVCTVAGSPGTWVSVGTQT